MAAYSSPKADGDNLKLTDPLTAVPPPAARPRMTSARSASTTQLRKALRVSLAQFDLSSPGRPRASGRGARDAARGRCGVIAVLRAHLPQESRMPAVKREIRDGLALADLDSDRADVRLAAVKDWPAASTDVYNRLTAMATPDRRRQLQRVGSAVRAAAQASIRDINRWRSCIPAYRRCCSA
jgi:hypothetical protein